MNPLFTTICWSLLTFILTLCILSMLGMKEWMKKKYYRNYLFYTLLARVVATCIIVGLVSSSFYFIPYYDNLRMEQKYGIKEVISHVPGNPELMLPLDELPAWLIEGTQKLTLVNEPLGYILTEELCVVGNILGTYDNETDEVAIYINESGFGDLEITWHEFLHRFWFRFMTEDEQSAFIELHDFECEENLIFTSDTINNYGNNYFRNCWQMDTDDEEFAYKIGWFILDKNHEMLSDKEVLYFSKLLRDYDLAEISELYRIYEAVALLRNTEGIIVNIDTTVGDTKK